MGINILYLHIPYVYLKPLLWYSGVTTTFVNTLWPRVTLSAIYILSVCMYYTISGDIMGDFQFRR